MEMMPRNVICWHPWEHLHLVCVEGILSSRHRNSSIIPNVRRPRANLLLLLLPKPQPLIAGRKLFNRRVGDATPAGVEVGEEGSVAKIKAPLSVMWTDLVPRADKGSSFLFLIIAYISLLNFVVISKKRKHLSTIIQVNTKTKKGNTDEPKTYFFPLQYQ